MAKTMIGLRVMEEVEVALEKMANEQARTKANMAEYIILDWIREHRPELLTDKPPKKTFNDYEK